MTCSRPPAPNLLDRRGEPLFFFLLALFSLFPHLPAPPSPCRVPLAHSHFLASLVLFLFTNPELIRSLSLSLSLFLSRSCSLSAVYWLGSSLGLGTLNVNFPPGLSSSSSSPFDRCWKMSPEKCSSQSSPRMNTPRWKPVAMCAFGRG